MEAVDIHGTPINNPRVSSFPLTAELRLTKVGGYYRQQPRQGVQVQYQRPGYQVQVNNGGMLCTYFPYTCQPLIPFAYALPQPGTSQPRVQVQHQGVSPPPTPPTIPVIPGEWILNALVDNTPGPAVSPQTTAGLANLESAFYPLLVGAIALLVIFDYASG